MSLPLLNYTSKLYPDTDLRGFGLIACQHLLGTTIDLFEELFKKGLKPESTWIIGKCYSTHEPVISTLRKLGVNVSEDSTSFDPRIEYDIKFQEYIANFSDRAISKLNGMDKLIILDDGGYLLEHINKSELNKPIFGVEQTTSGYEKLRFTELLFPIVNIAKSITKLKYESPHIVESILSELKKKVILSKVVKTLVIGQGAIGGRLKDKLTKLVDVYGCDKDGELCDFQGNFKEELKGFDVIISATGTTTISEVDLGRLKDGVKLISVSSSDREFPSSHIRISSSQKGGNCHDEYISNGIHLINGGFPINFTGSKHSLSPENAQLTRSLLFAGVCESVKTSTFGFNDLSAMQGEILKEYQALTSDEIS
jgi:S-adenosylhomocysteine hydrolase